MMWELTLISKKEINLLSNITVTGYVNLFNKSPETYISSLLRMVPIGTTLIMMYWLKIPMNRCNLYNSKSLNIQEFFPWKRLIRRTTFSAQMMAFVHMIKTSMSEHIQIKMNLEICGLFQDSIFEKWYWLRTKKKVMSGFK